MRSVCLSLIILISVLACGTASARNAGDNVLSPRAATERWLDAQRQLRPGDAAAAMTGAEASRIMAVHLKALGGDGKSSAASGSRPPVPGNAP